MTVAAVVLAAGFSTRFGPGDKLLADVLGRPMIRWTVEALAASAFSEIVVVTTGPTAPAIWGALAGVAGPECLRLVVNPTPARGMGTSIAAGIVALGPGCSGAAIVPGDMPALGAPILDPLLAAFHQTGRTRIVFPFGPAGTRRNPVLWPARFFVTLQHLAGSQGGKVLLQAHLADAVGVRVAERWRLADADTPEALDQMRVWLRTR